MCTWDNKEGKVAGGQEVTGDMSHEGEVRTDTRSRGEEYGQWVLWEPWGSSVWLEAKQRGGCVTALQRHLAPVTGDLLAPQDMRSLTLWAMGATDRF